MKNKTLNQYVVCVQNRGYEVSLEKRKIYRATSDTETFEHDLIRVIDESGQPYLYPQRFFISIKLPQPVLRAIDKAA